MSLSFHSVFFVALFVFTALPSVMAQDRSRQKLLQAFTSGLFNMDLLHPIEATLTPIPSAIPLVTLQATRIDSNQEGSSASSLGYSVAIFMAAAAEVSSQATSEMTFVPLAAPNARSRLESSLVPGPDLENDSLQVIATSVEPTLEFEELMPSKSPIAILPEMELISNPDGSAEASVVSSPFSNNVFEAEFVVFDPITVNCGSLDVRNTFGLDSNKSWYNEDSHVIFDPFAMTQFSSFHEALLYSTYRYADGNLTYTVPLKPVGVWKLALQWAEISPYYMHEGSRVFSVNINGIELDSAIDVYRDSLHGGYSPVTHTYVVEVQDTTVKIVLGQKVGQPMLSAFQVTYTGPNLP